GPSIGFGDRRSARLNPSRRTAFSNRALDRQPSPGEARQQRNNLSLRRAATDLSAAFLNRHVELAADPEAPRQIDSRLDRETGALDQPPAVARFERVEIRPGAVNLAPDRMA